MLEDVIHRLGAACLQAPRSVGDLDQNAALWVAVQLGQAPAGSSFRPPRLEIDHGRLADLPYLAALGFLIGAISTTPIERDLVRPALQTVLQRQPHTLEGGGFADDALVYCGLRLLASWLGNMDAIAGLARAGTKVPPHATVLQVLTGLADDQLPPIQSPLPSAAGEFAGVAVLELARRRRGLATTYSTTELVVGLERLAFEAASDLESMLLLVAAEGLSSESAILEAKSMNTQSADVKKETLYDALSRILGFLLESTQANPFHWSKDPQHSETLRAQSVMLREINSAVTARTYRITPLQRKYVIEAAHQSLESLQSLSAVAFQLSPAHGLLWVSITKSVTLLAKLFPHRPSEQDNTAQLFVVGKDEFSLYFSELMEQLLQFEDAFNELQVAATAVAVGDGSGSGDRRRDRADSGAPRGRGSVETLQTRNPDRVDGSEFLATVIFVLVSGLKDTADGPAVPKALAALNAAAQGVDPQAYVLSTIAGMIIVIPDDAAWGLDDAFDLLREAKVGFSLRVGVAHGSVEVVKDIDDEKNLIGPVVNTAARLATSPDNPGAVVHDSYANHVSSTLPSTHWLHRLKRNEIQVTGKPQDKPFRCFVAPESFLAKPLDADLAFKWRSAVLIAYDLPKFSGGDRSELRKRFTRLGQAFKRLWQTSPTPALVSPGGDGGVVVLRDVSLPQAAQIAERLRDLAQNESIGHSEAIAVKIRIGAHYGPVTEYRNARGVLRPAGLELFVADEIAGDELARKKNDIIVTHHLAESIANGSHEERAAIFEELPPLTKGPAAEVKRFVRRDPKDTSPHDQPPSPPSAPPLPSPRVETSDAGRSVTSPFEQLTTRMISAQTQTKGTPVAPAIWRLCAVPSGRKGWTKAELHQAITGTIVSVDGGTGQRARLPAVLRSDATQQRREDGTQLWLRVHEGLPSNERNEEQLGVKTDGTIWFQRAHFWDALNTWLDMGQCAFDTIVFVKMIVGVGNALNIASYDVILTLQAPRADMVVTIQTNGLAPKQPMRTAKAKSMRHETRVDVGPMTSLQDAVQANLSKQLVDGIANEFDLEGDPFFRGGGGASFLEIDEGSVESVLKRFQ